MLSHERKSELSKIIQNASDFEYMSICIGVYNELMGEGEMSYEQAKAFIVYAKTLRVF